MKFLQKYKEPRSNKRKFGSGRQTKMRAAERAFVEQQLRGAKKQHNRAGEDGVATSRATTLGRLQKSSILDTPLLCSQDGTYALYPVWGVSDKWQ